MTRVIKADGGGVATATADVLNLADIAAEARSIILEARKDAARIVAEARAKAEAIERAVAQKAYAEGFARGQSDGYAEGRGRAVQETHKRLAADAGELAGVVRKIADELAAARQAVIETAEQQMLRFVVELAEKVVSRTAARDPGVAQANLAKALRLARGAAVTVRVNPAQLEMLKAHCHDLAGPLADDGPVRLVADERIEPGGAKASLPRGEIDATVRAQWDAVVEALLGRESQAEQTTAHGVV